METMPFLLVFGLVGQAMFTARFLVQWIVSERYGRSTIPIAFWWFSLAGGVMLFTYALARHDLVFTLGQAAGLVVYARNLWMIRSARQDVPA
ncbi:lipid-A-disaccharide synthase N-terminal domain-containing protein [Paracoccus sp. CPCC 101403]|uniref:Lipid-A-disaccharide synthase N-terminal domain-containing protein n=2 Tax=Paracoccus broussonetiae TaxID=3075834 RepID=A0ABU3EGQ6_9RHOB|nr:lipid-A-disaccharide synthase N-terminal domain-containing protein [Paracoccus sp. CPCC 101403]MDT1063374.1 lipid-A-disaccharide synthase N-terminal domain-containing protein [Paracoccus sp. CPCC 101403]